MSADSVNGVRLIPIGRGADDLRFFIRMDGAHAGGITVHSVDGNAFSYGIAIAPDMRRRGVATAALVQLFEQMHLRGFARARVEVQAQNAASLALHRKLGFVRTGEGAGTVSLEKRLNKAEKRDEQREAKKGV